MTKFKAVLIVLALIGAVACFVYLVTTFGQTAPNTPEPATPKAMEPAKK
jgi:hypothetical protein